MGQAIGFLIILIAVAIVLPHAFGSLDEFLVVLLVKITEIVSAFSVHSL